jgi:carbon storage regulator
MLVLTRRPGESIIIGDGIKLTVVNVGPGRVKIGIEAPPSVRIDREEIHTRIQQEQSADVLAAVSSSAMENRSDQNTMINSGAETGILHNRIADQLPAEPPAAPTASTPPPTPAGRLPKFRAPRKPR